jgi:hypothetical protein
MNEWMNEWTNEWMDIRWTQLLQKKCRKFKMKLSEESVQNGATSDIRERLRATGSIPYSTRTRARQALVENRIHTFPTESLVRLTRQKGSICTKHNLTCFQTTAAKQMRTAFFRAITQRAMVILFRRFRTTYRSHLQGSRIPPPKKKPGTLVRGLYREECRRWKILVAWCQPIVLM